MRPTYLQVAHAILHTLSEGCGGIRHPPVFRYLSHRKQQGKVTESAICRSPLPALSGHRHSPLQLRHLLASFLPEPLLTSSSATEGKTSFLPQGLSPPGPQVPQEHSQQKPLKPKRHPAHPPSSITCLVKHRPAISPVSPVDKLPLALTSLPKLILRGTWPSSASLFLLPFKFLSQPCRSPTIPAQFLPPWDAAHLSMDEVMLQHSQDPFLCLSKGYLQVGPSRGQTWLPPSPVFQSYSLLCSFHTRSQTLWSHDWHAPGCPWPSCPQMALPQ